MKDCFICSPEHYQSEPVQAYIRQKSRERDKQWIFDLIKIASDSESSLHQHEILRINSLRNHEIIHINTPEWMLCRDVHPGHDTRYLVVFKNRTLRTIRDLDRRHVAMLRDIQTQVAGFMARHHSESRPKFRCFFHYMPSVYQLHVHISSHILPLNSLRRHYMAQVIDNIEKQSSYYTNALMLISKPLYHSERK